MSDTKNILVIGVGSIGERHLRCLLATERAHVAICEVNGQLRQSIAEQYGVDRTYGDLEGALDDPYDAAVIATPAHLHIPMACRLAEAGLHLLIEKPLSTSFNGIDSLQVTLARNHLRSAVAYVLRHEPALCAMREAIRAGRFGPPVQLVAVCGQHFPTYRPAYREIYYANRATGGGAIQDAMTHIMNAGQWLVGPIDRLVADAAHQVLEGVEVEDTVHVLARHGSVMASYSLNQHQAPGEITITVICEKGTCRCQLYHHSWAWMTEPDTAWHEESFGEFARDDMFIAQSNAFLDHLTGKAKATCSLQEGIQTLCASLQVLASVEDGTWKRVGSEKR